MKTLIILAALSALTLQAQQNTPAPAKVEPSAASIALPAPVTLTAPQKLILRDGERIAVAAEAQRADGIQKYLQSPEYKRLEFAALDAGEKFQRLLNEVMASVGCSDCSINLTTWEIVHQPVKAETKPPAQ